MHDFNLPMFHVLENLDKIIDVAQKRFRPRILWFLSGLETFQIKKETDSVLGCIKSVIASKKEQNLKNPDLLKDKKKLDVLDRLLLSEDDSEKPFNDEELKDEVFAFIGAGHETTTNSLTWIILALDQNPSSLLKMIAEIDSVLKPNHDLSFEDLSLLHYTEFVIKESMRMSPVVPFFGKYATKDTDLGEYKIKKDTTVFLNCLSVHLNPLYWDNATKFIPERWENGFVPIAGSYVPFGDGLTNCIGQKLAMIEMKVILARLYSQFNVEVVEGQDLTPVCSLTRGLKRGLKVILSPRNN